MVHIMPSFSSTSSSLAKLLARSLAASVSISTCVRCGRIISPRPVRWVLLRSRRNNGPPSSSSSPLMARVSDGCETLQASAARVKFSASQTARK